VFSRRTATPRVPNALTVALDRARDAGASILDLTVSNPTRAGLRYAALPILSALGDPRALEYSPAPFGLLEARRAVAAVYAEAGVSVDPSRIVLTASTSEAYGFLWKLLCDDGDDVLVPQPSYPLFDLLAQLEGVRLVPYPLAYDGRWHVELDTALAAVGPRTKAIMMVSPNNPTGSYVAPGELDALARTGLPLVSDEVFASFVLGRDVHPTSVLSARAPLVFALGGLSKVAALPQMKLGWIVVGGDDEPKVAEALARLELLGDAYLSVGTPIQLAAAAMLAARRVTHEAIMARLRVNLDGARKAIVGTAATLLDVEGGWYATIRLPATETDEQWALAFLELDGVYVHPGHFFDFPSDAHVVVSLLTPEDTFSEGIRRMLGRVEARITPPTRG